MNASRWGCPINLTLEARSTSRVVVPHIDPEQRLCSFGSRRRPHVDAVPILLAHISSSGAHGRPADRRALKRAR